MGTIGFPELLLILVILLLIFGGKKIPELARGLGSGIRNFRDAMNEGKQGDSKSKENEGR